MLGCPRNRVNFSLISGWGQGLRAIATRTASFGDREHRSPQQKPLVRIVDIDPAERLRVLATEPYGRIQARGICERRRCERHPQRKDQHPKLLSKVEYRSVVHVRKWECVTNVPMK
jgi:hypothetical protein